MKNTAMHPSQFIKGAKTTFDCTNFKYVHINWVSRPLSEYLTLSQNYPFINGTTFINGENHLIVGLYPSFDYGFCIPFSELEEKGVMISNKQQIDYYEVINKFPGVKVGEKFYKNLDGWWSAMENKMEFNDNEVLDIDFFKPVYKTMDNIQKVLDYIKQHSLFWDSIHKRWVSYNTYAEFTDEQLLKQI